MKADKPKEVGNVKCPICGLYTVIKGRCNPCTEALCTPLKEWVE